MCAKPDRDAAGTRSIDVDHISAHERAMQRLVTQLLDGADTAPITALVRDGGEAVERVREALEVIGELDLQLLVRVALDALVCAHADDRSAPSRGS